MKFVAKGQINPVLASVSAIVEEAPAEVAPVVDAKDAKGGKGAKAADGKAAPAAKPAAKK